MKTKIVSIILITALLAVFTMSGCDKTSEKTADSFTETTFSEPIIITDDTPLPYEKVATKENMQRMVDESIDYFTNLGMFYDDKLDTVWYEWFYGHQGDKTHKEVYSYNELCEENITTLKKYIDSYLIDLYGATYDVIKFNVKFVRNIDETYSIVFCYCGR